MNKTDLARNLRDKVIENAEDGSRLKDMKVYDAEAVTNAFMDVITDAMVAGERIQLVGFGTFEIAERASRVGRNPQTGEELVLPASKAVKFKAGKALKDAVNA